MGVPSFFRWLSRKYPSVIVNAYEEKPSDVDGTKVPPRTTERNPNFQEFDNLYLDMNGIIHPCTHPEDKPAPKTEDEMFALIFEYIDRLFNIVRPRRLLYMAVDGVAPRAKMNQQRSRRFRASKEAAENEEQIKKVREQLKREGIPVPPEKKEERFDSNCITPGTPFMSRLSVALKYYIHMRLNNDPGWKNILVILSDANVPGEGEHKIMDFIRKQRASPSHDPNIVHCLCGADADLIMLGLATHEVNFNIIREEFVPNQPRPCELCGQYGHELKECKGLAQDEVADHQSMPIEKQVNFIFLRIPVLREYLERELFIPNSPVTFDLEKAIDDWVFMCFFVGNDFLPHLPSLEIRENAIDRLIKLYKDMQCKTGGYLTNMGDVNIKRVLVILEGLGEVEDEIFKNRQEREVQYRIRNKQRKKREMNTSYSVPAFLPTEGSLISPFGGIPKSFSGSDTRMLARESRIEAMHYNNPRNEPVPENNSSRKRCREPDDSEDEQPYDEVRLWEDGWKERYYQSKFQVSQDEYSFRRKLVEAYVEGLCWVLKYYYQGCASWDWYFPYHYAPFASDFHLASTMECNFIEKTNPFKPLEQLMAVFPAASRKHLPLSWQNLMIDIDSPIIDFYPDDFLVDLNGKKFAWQGVALLPFVDEERLLKTLSSVEHELNEDEKERNSRGLDRIFVGSKHQFYNFVFELYNLSTEATNNDVNNKIHIDPSFTLGMAGTLLTDKDACLPNTIYSSPLPKDQFPDLTPNYALIAIYKDPHFEFGHKFSADRLLGAKELPNTLKPQNYDRNHFYRPQIGFSRNVPRASLSDSGHRFLTHEMHRFPFENQSAPNRFRTPTFKSGGPQHYSSRDRDNYDRLPERIPPSQQTASYGQTPLRDWLRRSDEYHYHSQDVRSNRDNSAQRGGFRQERQSQFPQQTTCDNPTEDRVHRRQQNDQQSRNRFQPYPQPRPPFRRGVGDGGRPHFQRPSW